MPRGGKRIPGEGKKLGRKPKETIVLPVLSKQLAIELYTDPSTRKRWQDLRDAQTLKGEPDNDLRFRVEREIQDQAAGKPVQPVDHNPQNQPIAINVNIRRIGT